MKNKIFMLVSILGVAMTLGSCSDFLDETPDKSGSAYIYHIDQLYGLTGSLDLYMFGSPRYANYGFLGSSYLYEQLVLSDAVEYDPKFWFVGMNGTRGDTYSMYCWNKEEFVNQYAMSSTWEPCYERIYRFNTVIENLDKVIQTTAEIRNQVEGEARFGRAYYHFLLLAQYCLWGEDAPGIGYRDNTNPGEVPARQTVGYTLGRIYDDLTRAEEALRKAGRTQFDLNKNFRPTVPTLQAFRARVDLYRGDYESALKNATDALAAHSTLIDFKNDPTYELSPSTKVSLLDESNSHVESVIESQVMMDMYNLGADVVASYEELYLASCTVGDYSPLSESYYNLFDRDNDARWIYFYGGYNSLFNTTLMQPVLLDGDETETPDCIKWDDWQWLKPANCCSYERFYSSGPVALLGMTTAEMYLIKAECLARAGQTTEAANALKTLRKTRFMNDAAAENIGGTIQEVLDERSREMTQFWRFWDIKRLNGAENAGIYIRRDILSDPTDLNSVTELVIAPEDGRWALPFYPQEAERMGWKQNAGWE